MYELNNDNPLLAEIMAEKAAAYFSTIRKMEAALKRLSEFDSAIHRSGAAGARLELLADAAEQAWFFIIQREAMRLPHYEELFAEFGIPEEVRKCMGPKRS